MVVHQSHYFLYAYLIPWFLVRHLNIPAPFVGLAFILGWISYVSTEHLVRHTDLLRVFISGHIFVAISLAVIGVFHNSLPVVLVAWFASGLGGGTVFCLTRLNQRVGKERVEMEFWEDIGHVLGVMSSLLLTVWVPHQLFTVFYASAGLAMTAACLMYFARLWMNRQCVTDGLSQ